MKSKKTGPENDSASRKIAGPSAACFFLALLLGGCQEQGGAPDKDAIANVQIVSVTQPSSARVRELSGRVEQTGIAPLAFEVSGRIIEIAVLDGQRFKQGQLLARIDPEPYALALKRATAQYQQLAKDLIRKRQLRDERILSATALEQLEAATEAARVQQALADRDLRNTELRAPFDGRLASRNVELWQTVQAGVAAFNLENMQRFDVSVDLPQSIAWQLPQSDDLTAVGWLPERPDLQFSLSYRERATQNSAGSGIFRLVFTGQPRTDLELLAGMSIRVRLKTAVGETNEKIMEVPVSALVSTREGGHLLWRVDPESGEVRAVPVELREIRRENARIEGDLKDEDKVVGAGSHFLREGQRVRAIGQNE